MKYCSLTPYNPSPVAYLQTATQYRVIASYWISIIIRPTFCLDLDDHYEQPGADVMILLRAGSGVGIRYEPIGRVWLWRDNIWTITYDYL